MVKNNKMKSTFVFIVFIILTLFATPGNYIAKTTVLPTSIETFADTVKRIRDNIYFNSIYTSQLHRTIDKVTKKKTYENSPKRSWHSATDNDSTIVSIRQKIGDTLRGKIPPND